MERLLPVNPVPPSVDAATGVASRDVTIDAATGLRARLYLPDPSARPGGGDGDGDGGRLPVVLYFHGGGLVAGSAADAPEHAFVNRLAARAGALAVSVEYRLAPEHPVPACYDDAWAALLWATGTGAGAADPWVRDRGDACSCSGSAPAGTSRTASPSAPGRSRAASPAAPLAAAANGSSFQNHSLYPAIAGSTGGGGGGASNMSSPFSSPLGSSPLHMDNAASYAALGGGTAKDLR